MTTVVLDSWKETARKTAVDLLKYGRHYAYCSSYAVHVTKPKCDCGYDKAAETARSIVIGKYVLQETAS